MTEISVSRIPELRKRLPEFDYLPDSQFVEVLRYNYAPHMDPAEWNRQLGYVPMGAAKDAALSFISGLPRGLGHIPGLPGDMEQMGKDLYDWGYSKFTGKDPGPHTKIFPTGEDVNNAVSAATGMQLYQPQTTLGEWADLAGQAATAGAVFGGPRTGAQVVGQAIKQGILPAFAGKEAGDIVHEIAPGIEGPVRAIVPVVTGVGASAFERAPAGKIPYEGGDITKGQAPNLAPFSAPLSTGQKIRTAVGKSLGMPFIIPKDLEQLKTSAYDFVEKSGIKIKQLHMLRIANNVEKSVRRNVSDTEFNSAGFAPVRANIQDLYDIAHKDIGTLSEIDGARRLMNDTAGLDTPTVMRAGSIMKKSLDDQINEKSLNSSHFVSPNVPVAKALKSWRDARKYAQIQFNSEYVRNIIYKAIIGDEKAGNIQTTLPQRLRNAFGSVASNKELMRTFSPELRQAINRVYAFTGTSKFTRTVATASPDSLPKITMGILLGTGFPAAIAPADFTDWGHGAGHSAVGIGTVMGAGALARKADDAITRSSANTVEAVTRGAKPVEPSRLLRTSQSVEGYTQGKDEKRDYSGKPLEITVTKPDNQDEINAWRKSMNLPPLTGGNPLTPNLVPSGP